MCAWALAEHHDPQVRLALLGEDPGQDIVELLVTDLNPAVQLAAAFRLRASAQGIGGRRDGVST